MDFKKLIRLFAPIMVEGALSVRRNATDRLVEMLHELQFVTRNIARTADSITVELQILDADLLYRLLAGEANRFLLASRVSHGRSIQDQPNNASWQAIENYYAAYYAVHYLLRLSGITVTNLDSRGTDAITRSNLGTPASPPVPGGLYIMHYDDASKMLTLKKNLKKSGGSHQEAWQLWEALVEKLRIRTNTDPVEYASTSIDLSEHKSFLVRSTAKYNPPEIRGEINYQFRGGSWIFEHKAKDTITRLQRSISSTQSPAATRAPTPEGLVSNNKIIIGLAKAVFLHVAEKYPNGICRSLANKYSDYIA